MRATGIAEGDVVIVRLAGNGAALAADRIFAIPASDLHPSVAWLGILSYTVQIYFDFSGYSDMACGAALLFGIRLPINFDLPYISASFSEFWTRWHISLSTWLRTYLYIPLGGNRHGRFRTYSNLMIVMGLGGLWHGAGLSYLTWGLFLGLLLVIERPFLKLLDALDDGLELPLREAVRCIVVVFLGRHRHRRYS